MFVDAGATALDPVLSFDGRLAACVVCVVCAGCSSTSSATTGNFDPDPVGRITRGMEGRSPSSSASDAPGDARAVDAAAGEGCV